MPLARAGKVKSTKKLKQETSPIGEVFLCFSRCKNSKESCVFLKECQIYISTEKEYSWHSSKKNA
jgi:hypothetical protein